MRILVVQETDWIGRNPILHHRMLEELSLDGADITVLDYDILWRRNGVHPLWQSRRVRSDVVKFLKGSAITVVRPAMLRVPGLARPTWLLSTYRELRRYIRSGKPDVVIGYGLSNALLARIYARKHRIPFVFHLFDSLHALAEPPALRPIAAAVERIVLRSADEIVIGHRGLRPYVERMGVRGDRLHFIPNGVTRRSVDAGKRAAVRARLGVRDKDLLLLFMGWLYLDCGLEEVIAELARDPARHADYKLLVVGDGDLRPRLEELREQYGLQERLILVGRRPVDEMPDFIGAADVCLFISHRTKALEYVVPSKVDEYMEMGKPVLATRLPGMELELGSVAGMLWIDSPADALSRLDQVLDDDSRPHSRVLASLGQSCLEYIGSRDDWQAVTRRFRAVLDSAVSAA